jgi:hypothetical protein
MKSTRQVPMTGSTTTPQARLDDLYARCGTPSSSPSLSAGDFAGDQESYRHDDGRPGAKDRKPQRGGQRGATWMC